MKTSDRGRAARWLAGAVAFVALLSVGVLLWAPAAVSEPSGSWLDSRVMCDKLRPHGCEPRVA